MKYDIAQIEIVCRSEQGNHDPLIELLRSDSSLNRDVRNYIAEELEKGPKKRFAQKNKRKLDVQHQDHRIFEKVRFAKQQLLIERLRHEAIDRWDEWQNISHADALRWLADTLMAVDQERLDNALRRNKGRYRLGL